LNLFPLQFFVRTANVTGSINLEPKDKMVMPGDSVEMEVELISPVPIVEGMLLIHLSLCTFVAYLFLLILLCYCC
jgi:translation elongation factor EF-Tu-like GTPase